ncbi:UDP-N-acetylmuramoyl-L-alanine--D-glutamate ligase [Persephonella sp.]|uniref:UDP-N-acetylmuramoyl-L-alanine--D-glutamate ligase n=1 Tax=Persephonella sp. TaxID=2060922 RepID=UPI0025EDCF79|nr:UDP-N-acetylmuramoyl-L-alanine--D-glutamate ligase [Persephonella sp.]
MILIYGKGKTGKALSDYMSSNSIPHIIKDDKDFQEKDLDQVNTVVISPGIPFYHKIYRLSRKRGIEVIGDIEYAYRLYRGCLIAVTGTDGKSTTTHIIGQLLKEKNPFVGGNYGEPFINAVKENKKLSVLELSSFQIYSTKTFKPNTAVLLNIAVDHLDWHKRKSHYYLSKYKIFKRLEKHNTAVLNFDQEIIRNLKTRAKKYFFSVERLPSDYEGIYFCGNSLILKTYRNINRIDISDFKLKGLHNIQNLMASVMTAYISGVPVWEIERKIPQIKPLPFRIQHVKTIGGVEFYNDSKSTTVQSVVKAVESFPDKNVFLILGGIYKGGDFSLLKNFLNVKGVFIIGRDKRVIKNMIKGKNIYLCDSLDKAVKEAYKRAEMGDVVLFSPGCSSFDMFKNYMERGEKFNKIVESLE